ncbi:MAG: hypothetical protein ABGZ49_11865 [Akkermansiaceae bacterium]
MKTNSKMRNPVAKRRESSVLIITVAILILVSLVAIGIWSLSSTTTRSGSAELAQLEARANARLALMIALGELQEQLGPDQRVSALAGILDENPETVAIEGVDHPNWAVVWSTEWQGESGRRDNKSPWVRNDEEGGLSDRCFEDGYDSLKEVLNYMVSGNEGGREVLGDDLMRALNADLGVKA